MKWMALMTGFRQAFAAALLVSAIAGCGGGGGGSASAPVPAPSTASPSATGPNVQPVVVDAGPTGNSANVLFTSVTVCMPGTAQCQTIDHVIVDTGSTGLRLLASELTLPLPAVIETVSAKPLLNCLQFIDQTYMWGSVATGDLYLGGPSMTGEKAANLPIQVVRDSTFLPAAPTASCALTGLTANDTVATLGAKGILGIGNYLQDCGSTCTSNATNGYYYTSSGGTSAPTTVSLAQQLQQPVSRFASNNNGVVISLPGVPDTGATTVSGALIFGIGTQANNSPGSPAVLALNGSGYFTTAFEGSNLTRGFIDSGSNGFFFGTSRFPLCGLGWYCPVPPTALQASNSGTNGVASLVNFTVSNALTLFSNGSFTAFSTLAGPIGDSVSFDWGLPFFYGRNVFTAIEGRSTPVGVGPYVAY